MLLDMSYFKHKNKSFNNALMSYSAKRNKNWWILKNELLWKKGLYDKSPEING